MAYLSYIMLYQLLIYINDIYKLSINMLSKQQIIRRITPIIANVWFQIFAIIEYLSLLSNLKRCSAQVYLAVIGLYICSLDILLRKRPPTCTGYTFHLFENLSNAGNHDNAGNLIYLRTMSNSLKISVICRFSSSCLDIRSLK